MERLEMYDKGRGTSEISSGTGGDGIRLGAGAGFGGAAV